jgi:hypothetical protein
VERERSGEGEKWGGRESGEGEKAGREIITDDLLLAAFRAVVHIEPLFI